MAQGLAPAVADHREVLVLGIDADVRGHLELIGLDDRQVEGHPDRQVGADRRVHGDQGQLGGLVQAGVTLDHPVDDGLAVLGFTDLEIRGVGRRLDEVAGGVHMEQARLLLADLAAEDQGGGEVDAEVVERFGIPPVHLAQHLAHVARRLEHVGHRPQALTPVLGRHDLPQHGHQLLGDRQVARTHEHHHPFAGALEDAHLAEGIDVVDTGVGTGVRQEHHTGIEKHADAVGHGNSSQKKGGTCQVPPRIGSGTPAREGARIQFWMSCRMERISLRTAVS